MSAPSKMHGGRNGRAPRTLAHALNTAEAARFLGAPEDTLKDLEPDGEIVGVSPENLQP